MTVRTITTGLPKRNIVVTGPQDSTTTGNRDQALGIDTDEVLHHLDDKHLPMVNFYKGLATPRPRHC